MRVRESRTVTIGAALKPSIASWVRQSARDSGVTVSQWLQDAIINARRRRMHTVRRRARENGNA